MKIRSRDGVWTVEVITFADSGEWLRVTRYGVFCKPLVRNPQDLAATFGIDLAVFEEAG